MQNRNPAVSLEKPKILVYLFGSLGDTLVAIPALRAVRRHFRNAELVLLQNIPPDGKIVRAVEVIPDDLIDRCIEYRNSPGKIAKFLDFSRLWRILRKESFHAAVYLVISERAASSVNRDKLFFQSTGVKEFYGFHPFSTDELYPLDEKGTPLMTISEAERKKIRLEKDGIIFQARDFQRPLLPLTNREIINIRKWLASRGISEKKKLISIAPGCKTPANAWNENNFSEIGKRLINEGTHELVIIGGKAERDLSNKLISEWQTGINSAGELSVRESAALISQCEFHFGVDTGTTHLAAAVGKPCFVLFHERDNPGQWFPIGNGHTIISHPVSCAGCRVQNCPVPNHPCMTKITVESVWKNLQNFMEKLKNKSNASTQVVTV